jgi:hypothetical protein
MARDLAEQHKVTIHTEAAGEISLSIKFRYTCILILLLLIAVHS